MVLQYMFCQIKQKDTEAAVVCNETGLSHQSLELYNDKNTFIRF